MAACYDAAHPKPAPEENLVKQRLAGLFCVVSAFVVLGACGGKGSPTASTPTIVSITVSSSGGTLVLGITETFTATAVMSNGTSQALVGGTWGTDAAAVATINPATGLVTSVATGDVTIFVDAQGVRGSKRITVVQSYTGIWSGKYNITACTQTGDFASPAINLCSILAVNQQPSVAFNLTQTGSTVTGQTALGSLVSSPFTTVAGPGGALTFQALNTLDTLRITQAWQLNVTPAGQLAGTVVQTWTDVTLTGQAVVSGTLLPGVVKSAAGQAFDLPSDGTIRSLADALAAVLRR